MSSLRRREQWLRARGFQFCICLSLRYSGEIVCLQCPCEINWISLALSVGILTCGFGRWGRGLLVLLYLGLAYRRAACLLFCLSHPALFQEGLTALHLAAEGGHCDCVKLLLEVGADVNAQTQVSSVEVIPFPDAFSSVATAPAVPVQPYGSSQQLVQG